MMQLPIPIPTEALEIFWFLVGATFGRAFGKRLDQDIQSSDWFKTLHPFWRWFLSRLLDALHHWWIGWGMALYFPNIVAIVWFGYGLFIDDLPDVPWRYLKVIRKLRAGIPSTSTLSSST